MKTLTVDWVAENYAAGDRQAVMAAVARGLLPEPSQTDSGFGWAAGFAKPSILIEAIQQVGCNGSSADAGSESQLDALADELLQDPHLLDRFRGAQGAQDNAPVAFVTIDHLCWHYGKDYTDIQQAVAVGILPPPVFNQDYADCGWPAAAFGCAENGLRALWGCDDEAVDNGPDGPVDDDDEEDTESDETRSRHLKQLAALTSA